MNRNEVITLLHLQGGGQLAQVSFWDSNGKLTKGYTYKNLTVSDLKVGDRVICETYDRLSVGVVQEVDFAVDAINIPYERLRHIVSKVDSSALDRIKAAEVDLGAKIVKAEINETLHRALGGLGLAASNLVTPALLGMTDASAAKRESLDEMFDDGLTYSDPVNIKVGEGQRTGNIGVRGKKTVPFTEEASE